MKRFTCTSLEFHMKNDKIPWSSKFGDKNLDPNT